MAKAIHSLIVAVAAFVAGSAQARDVVAATFEEAVTSIAVASLEHATPIAVSEVRDEVFRLAPQSARESHWDGTLEHFSRLVSELTHRVSRAYLSAEELVRRLPKFAQDVRRFVAWKLRGRQPADVDDVTQDVLLSAVESAGSCLARRSGGEGGVRNWLLGIAKNRCLEFLRPGKVRGLEVELVSDLPAKEPGEQSERCRSMAVAFRLLKKSRPRDAAILYRRCVEEAALDELAAEYDVASRTIEDLVWRTKRRLRDRLTG